MKMLLLILVAVSARADFVTLPSGIKIQSSCIEKNGKSFVSLVNQTFSVGIQCFERLDRDSGLASSGVRDNLKKAKINLSTGGPLQIACSEQGYDWTNTNAHASTSPGQKSNDGTLVFPFVSINPELTINSRARPPLRSYDLAEYQRTLFHEFVHTLGHLHRTDIEYPGACADCCFADPSRAAIQRDACKVCVGNYRDINDPKYMHDLAGWERHTGGNFSEELITKFLDDGGDRREAIGLLASMAGPSEVRNRALVDEFMARYSPLTAEEQESFSTSKEYDNESFTRDFMPLARMVARGYLAAHADKDYNKALKIYETMDLTVLKKTFSDPGHFFAKYELQTQIRADLDFLYKLFVARRNDADVARAYAAIQRLY